MGVAMTDMSTGLYAYGAILAALMVQRQTGRGQKIDCDLLSTQVGELGVGVGLYCVRAGLYWEYQHRYVAGLCTEMVSGPVTMSP